MKDIYYRVLDKGWISLKDVMGSDERIEQVARTSYAKGTRKVSDTRNLIRYLVRNSHSSPLEFGEMVFHIHLPIYVFRQMVRHRTASISEASLRYSIAPETYEEARSWRKQSTNNKQGSEGVVTDTDLLTKLSSREKSLLEEGQEIYQERLAAGVAREQARKDLPLSLYTTVYWKMDLRNLLHFLSLRLDSHAQQEIREYALIIGKAVSEHFPLVWEAFTDYQLNAVRFSSQELEVLFDRTTLDSLGKRERAEYLEKLNFKKKDHFSGLVLQEVPLEEIYTATGENNV